MRKDGLNVHVFQNRGWGTEALYAELNEIVEEATSSYSATDEFLQYILCLWLRIIRRSDQGV